MKIHEIPLPDSNNNYIKLFELKNSLGTTVQITNAGACITSIKTEDKNANFSDIVLGFDHPEEYLNPDYLNNCVFLGATVGRFANRIAKGKFELEGKAFNLKTNNGENHLHGGPTGFHSRIWEPRINKTSSKDMLVMTLTSPDNDEGYPGTLKVEVTFFLTNENELIINYKAESDAPTPVNLTNHSYFNLSGKETDILDHEVMIFSDKYTPKKGDIPTGEIAPTQDTPFDFKDFHKVGERLNELLDDAYDHNMIINGEEGELRRAALVREPDSGRTLEVFTTMPGMQFYIGRFLDGTYRNGTRMFDKFAGMCFETQYFPDSPNWPAFPSCIFGPERPYRHTTVFKFGVNK
ncbi:aldose epimerase family protein [Thermophagus sp. OGC60D27]|uniref:aldose epimerase family protein n=1 Tax=Thermophagus sp. OGC60D27 TaxID=3458415 RepID=UPI0040377AD9